MPNFVGCFPWPQIFIGCFQAVKYMTLYNTKLCACVSVNYGIQFMACMFLVKNQPFLVRLVDEKKKVLFRSKNFDFTSTIYLTKLIINNYLPKWR